jgi:hypothetical protein
VLEFHPREKNDAGFERFKGSGPGTPLLLVSVYFPGLPDVLQVTRPNGQEWALILGLSFVPLIIGQAAKSVY